MLGCDRPRLWWLFKTQQGAAQYQKFLGMGVWGKGRLSKRPSPQRISWLVAATVRAGGVTGNMEELLGVVSTDLLPAAQ